MVIFCILNIKCTIIVLYFIYYLIIDIPERENIKYLLKKI